MKMKSWAIDSAIQGMIEAGLNVVPSEARKEILKFMIIRDMNTKQF